MEKADSTKKNMVILIIVLCTISIVGIIGYKIWKKNQTISGDPVKNNRVIKIIRS